MDSQEAMGQFLKRCADTTYVRRLYSLAYRILRVQGEAEDAVAEGLANVLANLARGGAVNKDLDGLVSVAVRNVAITYYRRLTNPETRQPWTKSLEEAIEATGDTFADFDLLPLGDQAILREETRMVWEAVGTLESPRREVIILYYRHDLTTVEIAKVQQRDPEAVKKDLQRGRDQLRQLLTRGGDR